MAHMMRTGAALSLALVLALAIIILIARASAAPNPRRGAILDSLRAVGITPNEAVMLGGDYYLIDTVEVTFSPSGDPIITVTTKRPHR